MQATVASTQRLAADLAAFLIHIHKTSSKEWFGTVEELNLTMTQVKALHALDDRDLAVTELAEEIGLSVAAMSRAADGLVQRGLLERRECADDRRSRRVRRSAEGDAIVARLQEARIAGLSAFVEGLDELQRSSLSAALKDVMP